MKRRPMYAIIDARTGDELDARYWHPAAQVVEAPPRLPRRGGR